MAEWNPNPKQEPNPGATVMGYCPTCKERIPVFTNGVKRQPKGSLMVGQKAQDHRCPVCKTLVKVATGEDGKEYQENYVLAEQPDETAEVDEKKDS